MQCHRVIANNGHWETDADLVKKHLLNHLKVKDIRLVCFKSFGSG